MTQSRTAMLMSVALAGALCASCSAAKHMDGVDVAATSTTATISPTTTTVNAESSTTSSAVSTTTSVTTTTAVVDTTVPPTTVPPTTVPAATVAPPPVVVTRPIAAIDANGDAVIVAPNGAVTLLYDGVDPDDPPPDEGETTSVDGVAVTPDQSTAFIGVCCEPVSGTLLTTTPPAVATADGGSKFGHAPALSPDGTKLASVAYDSIVVSDLALNPVAGATYDVNIGAIIEVMFTDDDSVVAIIAGSTGTILQSFNLDGSATLAPVTSNSFSDATWTDESLPSFAGRAGDHFYVAGLADSTLSAFDSATLQRSGGNDRTMPAGALSAWFLDGELRWVDGNRKLHVGGLVMPGEFIWVR